ncbi:MAG: exodeoxyribonuclease III [bacterium]
MRIINLSVDGIHQAVHRGLLDWLKEQDAEIICLQDLRASEPEVFSIPGFELPGYFCYVLDSPEPHSRGVAIFSRQQPKALMFGFGMSNGMDTDGRYLQADFDHVSVGSILAPTSDGSVEQQEIKDRFFAELQSHLLKVTKKRRRYILCGNWQIAHSMDDVENAEAHLSDPCFLENERLWLNQLFTEIHYLDAFRQYNRDSDEYSYWPQGEIGEGDGWRTDFQVISQSLAKSVEYAVIYKAKTFSSHAPVIVDYDLEFL